MDIPQIVLNTTTGSITTAEIGGESGDILDAT